MWSIVAVVTCVRLTYVVLGPLLFVSVASYKVLACARP